MSSTAFYINENILPAATIMHSLILGQTLFQPPLAFNAIRTLCNPLRDELKAFIPLYLLRKLISLSQGIHHRNIQEIAYFPAIMAGFLFYLLFIRSIVNRQLFVKHK